MKIKQRYDSAKAESRKAKSWSTNRNPINLNELKEYFQTNSNPESRKVKGKAKEKQKQKQKQKLNLT